jgi:hypothetical protein
MLIESRSRGAGRRRREAERALVQARPERLAEPQALALARF